MSLDEPVSSQPLPRRGPLTRADNDFLNKPLPSLRRISADFDLDPSLTGAAATLGYDANQHWGRNLGHARANNSSNMSVFALFSRPKFERSRGYAEAGLPEAGLPMPPPPPPSSLQDQLPTRQMKRSSRGDLRGARLEKPMPGLPKVSPVPTTAALPLRHTPSDPHEFDILHPLPFKRIFHMATKVGPAHTCVVPAAKGTVPWKMNSSLSLTESDSHDRPSSRRSSRVPTQPPPNGLSRKIFAITKSGYLLQFGDRGSSDRLPERFQRLTKDTYAVASDLVPGKPYTVQVTQSRVRHDATRPDSPSFLSRWRAYAPKRQIPSTLIILDNADELESWLSALRKEISRVGKSPASTPPKGTAAIAAQFASATSAEEQEEGNAQRKELGSERDGSERTDSPRQSLSYTASLSNQHAGRGSETHDETLGMSATEGLTAREMYHQQVKPVSAPVARTTHPADPQHLHSPTSAVKQPTRRRQIDSAPSPSEPTPVRKDSLMTFPEAASDPASQQKKPPALRAHKRASHHGASPMASSEHLQLRSVSSTSRIRALQLSSASEEPLPPVPSFSTPDPILYSNRMATAKRDNDEYHAFQQSMSMRGAAPKTRSSPPDRSRRHSTAPSQSSSVSSTTADATWLPGLRHHEQRQRRSAENGHVKQLPPRLPFKLRHAVDASKNNVDGDRFPPPSSDRPGSPRADGFRAKSKLRRPASMQVRPETRPFFHASPRSTSATQTQAAQGTSTHSSTTLPTLRTTQSFAVAPTSRQRNHEPTSTAANDDYYYDDDEDEDEDTMFIFQGGDTSSVVTTRKQSVEGPLPPMDLGMPLVALGPPPPPPETPLPRLPPPPPTPQGLTSPSSGQPVGRAPWAPAAAYSAAAPKPGLARV